MPDAASGWTLVPSTTFLLAFIWRNKVFIFTDLFLTTIANVLPDDLLVWCFIFVFVAAKTVFVAPAVAAVALASALWPCLLGWPLVVVQGIATCWSIAAVGPARKTLSTLLILVLSPLYPILVGAALAILAVPTAIAVVAKVNTLALAPGSSRRGWTPTVQSWSLSLLCCCRGPGDAAAAPYGSVQDGFLDFFDRDFFGVPHVSPTPPRWTPCPLPATALTMGTLDILLDSLVYLPYLLSRAHGVVFARLAAFRAEQRALAATVPPPDDLRWSELLFGICFALLSGSTVGPLVVALTLLKAPVLLASAAVVGLYRVAELLGWVVSTLPADNLIICFPLAALALGIAYVAALAVLPVAILLSAAAKLVASFLWPAYVASGWLRAVGARRRSASRACVAPFVQGGKAAYQVLWAGDVITNAAIVAMCDRGALYHRVRREFEEMARGTRDALSAECRVVSCLPPVVVGIFRGGGEGWEVEAAIARAASALRTRVDVVRAAWSSLGEQMKAQAAESVGAGLLTDDYVDEAPPALVIGLPASVLLSTIERSPSGELVLSSGLAISAASRPRTKFADALWRHLDAARAALREAAPAPEERALLVASLLAGGAEEGELPPPLAAACRAFYSLPADRLRLCRRVARELTAAAVECSREPLFCTELRRLMQARGEAQAGAVPARARAPERGAELL